METERETKEHNAVRSNFEYRVEILKVLCKKDVRRSLCGDDIYPYLKRQKRQTSVISFIFWEKERETEEHPVTVNVLKETVDIPPSATCQYIRSFEPEEETNM